LDAQGSWIVPAAEFSASQNYTSPYPEGLKIIGSFLVFEQLVFPEDVGVFMRIDTSGISSDNYDKVQVYERPENGNEIWTRIETDRPGPWLSFSTDKLGTFVPALDTVVPSLTWTPPESAMQNKTGFCRITNQVNRGNTPVEQIEIQLGDLFRRQ